MKCSTTALSHVIAVPSSHLSPATSQGRTSLRFLPAPGCSQHDAASSAGWSHCRGTRSWKPRSCWFTGSAPKRGGVTPQIPLGARSSSFSHHTSIPTSAPQPPAPGVGALGLVHPSCKGLSTLCRALLLTKPTLTQRAAIEQTGPEKVPTGSHPEHNAPHQLFPVELEQWRSRNKLPLPQDCRDLGVNLPAHNQQDAISFPKGYDLIPPTPRA